MFDGKAFGLEIVEAVKQHIDRSVSPLVGRIEAIERRFSELPTPKDGNDADVDAVAAIVAERFLPELKELRSAVEALPAVPDTEELQKVFYKHVDEQIGLLPAKAFELPDIPALIAEAVAALPAPQDGNDADPELVASLVAETTERILAGWERPQDGKDGKSVTLEDISIMAETMISKRYEECIRDIALPKDGKDGRDGLDAVEFFRGADGHLIVTMSNGTTRDLGEYVGKDADIEAIQAKIAAAIPKTADVDPAMITRMIDEAVAKHTPESLEFAPDEVAHSVSLALKTMAGFVSKVVPEKQERQAPVNIHMPSSAVTVTMPDQPSPVVNMAAPVVNVAPAEVHVEMPKRGKEVTRVTEWDKSGRVKAFEKSEVED